MPASNVLVVVQARMASSRLPGKVMLPLMGKPLLLRLIERVRAAPLVTSVAVATSTTSDDDVIASLCDDEGILCIRGHPTDLLDRHYKAACHFGGLDVAKIPSDCPLISPSVINRVLSVYRNLVGHIDYLSNLHPPTYPDGNDVEIIAFPALERAWWDASRSFEREHTTPYFWEHPERFRLANVWWETGLDYSMTHRWSVDYPADYELVKAVYEALYPTRPRFDIADILSLLSRRPDIAALNAGFVGVNWYRHHLPELTTIRPAETRMSPDDENHPHAQPC